MTDAYENDAFGNLLSSSGSTPNDCGYAGERFDSTLGMQYLRARYMNPKTDRFLNADTASPNVETPLTLNRYIYGNADPVNQFDRSGLAVSPQKFGYDVEDQVEARYLEEHEQPAGEIIFGRVLTGFNLTIKPDITNLDNPLPPGGKTWEEIKPFSISGVARAGRRGQYTIRFLPAA